ncbi:MAG: aryl-sulfate sulfotransferase [Eudoraea sp.]|uniref:aryl-sulfate sulfotransferase n=1 Tax=Eudoraea sp. TaxID=1979955 RepID=UPI003267F4DB
MKNLRITSLILLIFLAFVVLSCKNDDSFNIEPETTEDPDSTDDSNSGEDEDTAAVFDGSTDFINPDLVFDSYILVNDANSNRAFLIDKNANLLFEWPLGNNIGNDVFLLPDNRLLAILEADTPLITFGGKGGKIQFIQKDGTIDWNFDYSTEDYITHHDVELLPNGNIIALVWERMPVQVAIVNGSVHNRDIYTEAIIEIDPKTDQIVWEWHSWDHLVQDYDDTKENFGIISDNPQLINFNYTQQQEDGDIMHSNGIAYDEVNDLIFMSVNFFHEVWVIDHSTNTMEATSSTGGNYEKGGDLVYRFGNPTAYNNSMGDRLFYNNHFPNLIDTEVSGQKNMLIFVNNMNNTEQSVVYELQFPNIFELLPNTNNEPEIVWSFTDPELYSPKVSGAVTLPNGNRLITEGDFGFWEVTEGGEVVWKLSSEGFFWRGYHYNKDAPEIEALGF